MRKAVVVLSCLCLGILAVLSLKISQPSQMRVLRIDPPKMDFRAARETFPFSVIPGGIRNSRELSESIMKDEVVREHYVDLEPSRMWAKRLDEPMLAYVSFRNGSTIGWTTHPVTIAANELVLTDGKRMVRARCGNRIEVKRPEPLPATTEIPALPPPDVAMDTGLPGMTPPEIGNPILPRTEISTLVGVRDPRLIVGTTPVAPPVAPPTTGTPSTGVCCAVIPPACCGNPPKPPTSVPEPNSLLLFGAGGLAVWVSAMKLRRK